MTCFGTEIMSSPRPNAKQERYSSHVHVEVACNDLAEFSVPVGKLKARSGREGLAPVMLLLCLFLLFTTMFCLFSVLLSLPSLGFLQSSTVSLSISFVLSLSLSLCFSFASPKDP